MKASPNKPSPATPAAGRQGYGLLLRVVLAIALGTVAGLFLPAWALRLLATFNSLFGEFLGFMIPLIILGLVTPAIADLGKGGGRMLAATLALAYLATLLAGAISYAVSSSLFPSLIAHSGAAAQAASPDALASSSPAPFFTLTLPPPLSVMTALALSFTFGLGIAYTRAPSLLSLSREARGVVTKAIERALIPLLPPYILCIFALMASTGQATRVLRLFSAVILVIFALHIAWLLLLYALAGLTARRNPLRLLLRMLPAYATALGTQSSAATIPVTLRQTLANGVSPAVAEFAVPLCATVHLSGSMLKIVACSVALMAMQGQPHGPLLFAGFICLLAVTMVAAPGVPGGAVMAALGVLASTLGFTDADQALMIALYIAMDCFGTACNVTGDGALALIIDRLFSRPASPA